MEAAASIFEIVLTALACPFALPLVIENKNEERD